MLKIEIKGLLKGSYSSSLLNAGQFILYDNQLLSAFPLYIRGKETSLVPPELKNKHGVESFILAKKSKFKAKY